VGEPKIMALALSNNCHSASVISPLASIAIKLAAAPDLPPFIVSASI
jgi:hypothetical protein